MIEADCPIAINGFSTGCPPIQVKIRVVESSIQNVIFVSGRNIRLRCFEVCMTGSRSRIRIENRRAKTPPNLFGIERKIA